MQCIIRFSNPSYWKNAINNDEGDILDDRLANFRFTTLNCTGMVIICPAINEWCSLDSYLIHSICGAVQVGERIRVILDCDDNTLAFEKNYEFLGNAAV